MSDKLFDLKGLLSRTMKDREIAKEVVETFLQEIPQTLDRLTDAAKEADIPTCRERSHEIKGASASVGAIKMQEVASIIQKQSEENNIERVKELTEELLTIYLKTKNEIHKIGLMD